MEIRGDQIESSHENKPEDSTAVGNARTQSVKR